MVTAGGRAIVQSRQHAGWAGREGHVVGHVHRRRWDHRVSCIHIPYLVLQIIQHFVGTVPALHAVRWHSCMHGGRHMDW